MRARWPEASVRQASTTPSVTITSTPFGVRCTEKAVPTARTPDVRRLDHEGPLRILGHAEPGLALLQPHAPQPPGQGHVEGGRGVDLGDRAVLQWHAADLAEPGAVAVRPRGEDRERARRPPRRRRRRPPSAGRAGSGWSARRAEAARLVGQGPGAVHQAQGGLRPQQAPARAACRRPARPPVPHRAAGPGRARPAGSPRGRPRHRSRRRFLRWSCWTSWERLSPRFAFLERGQDVLQAPQRPGFRPHSR